MLTTFYLGLALFLIGLLALTRNYLVNKKAKADSDQSTVKGRAPSPSGCIPTIVAIPVMVVGLWIMYLVVANGIQVPTPPQLPPVGTPTPVPLTTPEALIRSIIS